jgi:hypothetical protein
MVTTPVDIAAPVLAAVDTAERLIEQLEPERRVAVVMALLAIVILGIFLVTTILLGGSWARRLARHSRGPTKHNSTLENKRARKALEPILPPPAAEGETTVVRRKSDDTIIEP